MTYTRQDCIERADVALELLDSAMEDVRKLARAMERGEGALDSTGVVGDGGAPGIPVTEFLSQRLARADQWTQLAQVWLTRAQFAPRWNLPGHCHDADGGREDRVGCVGCLAP